MGGPQLQIHVSTSGKAGATSAARPLAPRTSWTQQPLVWLALGVVLGGLLAILSLPAGLRLGEIVCQISCIHIALESSL